MAASDFSPSAQIKGYHVNFRPEPKLKREITAAITYRLVKKEE